jgi:hypothetical protein
MSSLRRAFTLLEILLALGLATACVTLVCMAIHFYLQTVDIGRTQVEETQLARSILQQIAFDLKQTVNYQAPSRSAAGGGTGSGASAGARSNEGSPSAADSSGNSGSSADSGTGNGAGSQQEAETPSIPGLYGNQYELAIDVGRMPRLDELEQLMATGDPNLLGAAGGLQTVAYYVRGSAGTAGALGSSGATASAADSHGLVRRSTGRPMTVWALENGAMDWLTTQEKLLAAEVTAIEFRYYDGTQWVSFWDTQEAGGLPLAVEVAIALTSASAHDLQRSFVSGTREPIAAEPTRQEIHRLIVALPMAQAASASSEATASP